jgi:23S rRNA (adenine2030-N6)-methyltransferase
MNYRHIYHAGNFTEVLKHTVLTLILDYLRQKPAPFCYIDTHAGEGIYDLSSEEAEKTGEFNAGVMQLIRSDLGRPSVMNEYWEIISQFRTGDKITHYPGSPYIAYSLLREQDCMILNEFHAPTCQRLKQNFHHKSRIAIHQRDAYEFLPAIVPPPASRGVVLVDPPFENKEENLKINLALEKSLKRWAQGIYLIWYPISVVRSWNSEAAVLHSPVNKYLIAELTIQAQKPHAKGLLGCRLLVINPPWTLAGTLKSLLPHLWEIWNIDRQGGWKVVTSDDL